MNAAGVPAWRIAGGQATVRELCMGHVFVHTGEVFLGLELARAAAG